MSSTPVQEPPAQGLSSDSGQTIPSRPIQLASDTSASKRLCFYKSGDYKFSGHRMVVNARTFKTFEALLDTLSKKVPLPFGVRTITTPRGTHFIKALEDLNDGGAYVCSDRKRVKPLNLEEVNRRQVPWNTTRPISVGRRRRQGFRLGPLGQRNEATTRPAKVTDRVAVRTPKRLLVIKNRDPTVKRTIVLQRRTAPTYDALLDYLSQILEFPVLKLYSTDGRRVDGLATLILCSGVVVAAGNEPFRLGSYSFHRSSQMAQATYMETVESILQPRGYKNKTVPNGRSSRNFSLSSERFIVNQIKKSQNGSMNGHFHHHEESFETELNQHPTSKGTHGRVGKEHRVCIVPQEDDIEKSFRVNQDGSMTVEMKVHLTIKEEEMLHWTTTLSRSTISKRTVCAPVSESGNSSPDSNNASTRDSSGICDGEMKEDNYAAGIGKGVGFKDEPQYEGYSPTALKKTKTNLKRTPTPGPRHVNKKASVENVKMVTESGVQESTLGHYSYMERTADGETTEGYCVVRHSSSSSNRPVPKPRKTASAGTSHKHSNSSIRSSGVAEVLQIQNNGMEVTETVMHIYESQGCYDNYLANEEYSVDSIPLHGSSPIPESKPSTDSRPRSSSNDCDIDCGWQPPAADSQQRQKEEMLSLSSEPVTLTQEIRNNLSSNSLNQETLKKDNTPKSTEKKLIRPARNQKSSTPTSSTDIKPRTSKISSSKNSKHSSSEKLGSDASLRKKSGNSSESAKGGQKTKRAEIRGEKPKLKESIQGEKLRVKSSASLGSTKNGKVTPPKTEMASVRYNGHNVNSPSGRPQMKKNISDILQTKHPPKKTTKKPKSMTETTLSPPRKSLELSESVSMPSINPSPAEIHQYVENWLEKVSPEAVPYTEEAVTGETPSKTNVVFQIGGDSESDEKNESQTNSDGCYPTLGDTVKKSTSCLSVPFCHQGPALLQVEQKARGLCVSMPSVRVDPVHQESNLRSHKSAEAIGPDHEEPSSSNLLSPKARINPVLKQLCSSIQCIRRASDSNTTSNLEKSNSLPDFPTQVASVFGSSCKALLSFLSVMTLRDNMKLSAPEDDAPTRTDSEAMLMMESLQKISAIDDEEVQRESLTDLQSNASSQFRERWRDFLIMRERLESEPLSPRISETEFALDVVSEGGDAFEDQQLGIDELMEELDIPQDLREEIVSTIQQTRSFYPAEESTFLETDRNQSESEEDLEQFVKECEDEPEVDIPCVSEGVAEINHVADDEEGHHSVKDQTQEEAQESEIERDGTNKEQEAEGQEIKEEEPLDDKEFSEAKEIDGDNEENEQEDREREEVALKAEVEDEEQERCQEETGTAEESVEKVQEEEVTEDEDVVGKGSESGKEELAEQTDKESREGESGGNSSVEETDEREGAEETDEEGRESEDRQEEEMSKMKEVDNNVDVSEEESGHFTENVKEATEVSMEVTEVHNEEQDEDNGNELKSEEEEVGNEVEDTEEEEDKSDELKGKEVTEVNEEANEDEEDDLDEEEQERGVTEEADEEKEEEEEEEEDNEEQEKGVTEEADEEKEEEEDNEEQEKWVTEDPNEEEEEDNEEEGEVMEAVDEEEEDIDAASEEERGDIEEALEEEDGEEDDFEGSDLDKKEKMESVSEGENEEEVKNGEENEGEDENEGIKSSQETTDEEKDSGQEQEKMENSAEEESVEDKEMLEEVENEEKTRAVKTVEEEEREVEEEEINEETDQVEEPDEAEEGHISEDFENVVDDEECENLPEEASSLSSCEEAVENRESPTKYSSEGQCADDKGNGIDSVKDADTDEGGEQREERKNSVDHPVEISQELLDFVNDALKSSSLIFTYDSQGNIRIEPDSVRVVQTQQSVIPKSRKDSSYGLKRLPSPNTSDLSDYRPETSASGGYKSQDSVDILSDSAEETSGKPSPVQLDSRRRTERTDMERVNSKLSVASNSEALQCSLKNEGSFSTGDSDNKTPKEDLSYFNAGSSLKIGAEVAVQATECISSASEKDSHDGVLIDQGRWLLKENHLIRKSPPPSLGMYENCDSTSTDTGQENNCENTLGHCKTQQNPMVAISSSEIEELARPLTPKCTYFNMPHGSDSDPFLDDCSIKSGKKHSSSAKGRGFRVSPVVDTSKTWANKNGSMSSFASVEFKIQDRKVHPEGEPSAQTQARRTSSGEGSSSRSRDSLEALHVRCGQYCPIL